MYDLINTLHSYNRYLLLVALLFVLYRSITGWMGRKPYEKLDNTASAILLGLTHLQLLLGLVLYAVSPIVKAAFEDFGAAMKNSWLRYIAVEHVTAMLIAVVLIQMGRTLSKRTADPVEKHRKVAIYTGLATIIIVVTLGMKGLLFGTLKEAMGQ